MRRLILAAALLSVIHPAWGMSIAAATHEARSFLGPCRHKDEYRQGLCQITQYDFIEEYVRALAGRSEAAGSTAMSFSVVGRTSLDLGGPANQVLACAWSLVWVMEDRRNDPGKRQYARSYCSVLPPAQRNAAVSRAFFLRQRILLHPVRLPAGWMPPGNAVPPPNGLKKPSGRP